MSETKNEVYQAIENAERDLSIKEIANRTGISRNTASKYLTALKAEGRITTTRQVGNAVFFDVPQPA